MFARQLFNFIMSKPSLQFLHHDRVRVEAAENSPTSLNVICLVSGGKDSFYSLLHCQRNGHKVVAIANLYPPPQPNSESPEAPSSTSPYGEEQADLNSHMYQTAGHTILSLYSKALSIPLYRAPILGSAVDKGRYYSLPSDADETESLIPLLRQVMAAHPDANAVSAGAILSTYQRTRIESVATRLGLTPLAYLWQYPSLPWERGSREAKPDAMLDHMNAVGLEARIVKVASGGLDDGILWGDIVGDRKTRERTKKGVGRFGGSVLGEGGEYETLVVGGPQQVFRGRINVEEEGRKIQRGEGGEAWLWLDGSKTVVEAKDVESLHDKTIADKTDIIPVEVPYLLDPMFERLRNDGWEVAPEAAMARMENWELEPMQMISCEVDGLHLSNLTSSGAGSSAKEQMEGIVTVLKSKLSSMKTKQGSISADSIVFTTILLRSMKDFAEANAAYSTLFTKPNPPARVTVACGNTLPKDLQVMASFVLDTTPDGEKEGLHVQSRSFWAPANIGPYSQAISVLSSNHGQQSDLCSGTNIIYVAGQIPLIPNSMELIHGEKSEASFNPDIRGSLANSLDTTQEDVDSRLVREVYWDQLILSLQHLWRIGIAMKVDWWVGGITFVAGEEKIAEKASMAWTAWDKIHWQYRRAFADAETNSEDEDPSFDAWHQKYGLQAYEKAEQAEEHTLPNYKVLKDDKQVELPHFTVQVSELPRDSLVEWQALGVQTDKVAIKSETLLDGMLRCQEVNFDGSAFTFYEIPDYCSNDELESCLRFVDEKSHFQGPEKLGRDKGERHITIYTAGRGHKLLPPAQIIPCRSVWGRRGEKLGCGAVMRHGR
jgi:diphthine-ammonia ligase